MTAKVKKGGSFQKYWFKEFKDLSKKFLFSKHKLGLEKNQEILLKPEM